MAIEIIEEEKTLFEKIMAHFGWYKVKMVDFPLNQLDVNYTFSVHTPEKIPAKKRTKVVK